jgi:DNA-binding MarR family transcriptional regulator
MRRDDWDITQHLLYHLSFTTELIAFREEIVLQEACSLTLSEWRILTVIASFAPISSKDITRVTTLNKVGVSRGIARLTAQGLIERAVSDSDNRMQYLSLTPAGRQRHRKARESFGRWSDSLLGVLGPDEVRQLKQVLMKLRARLGEITDEERAHSEMFIFGSKS